MFQGIFWDQGIQDLSRYTVTDIYSCCQDLMESFYAAPAATHTAIYEKYKSVRLSCVSVSFLPASLPPLDLAIEGSMDEADSEDAEDEENQEN